MTNEVIAAMTLGGVTAFAGLITMALAISAIAREDKRNACMIVGGGWVLLGVAFVTAFSVTPPPTAVGDVDHLRSRVDRLQHELDRRDRTSEVEQLQVLVGDIHNRLDALERKAKP